MEKGRDEMKSIHQTTAQWEASLDLVPGHGLPAPTKTGDQKEEIGTRGSKPGSGCCLWKPPPQTVSFEATPS